MNDETKKKIEDAAVAWDDMIGATDQVWANRLDAYENGAEFGYNLALEQADVLVKALEVYTKLEGFSGPAKKALKQFRKNTE